jgi:hypothetical protein
MSRVESIKQTPPESNFKHPPKGVFYKPKNHFGYRNKKFCQNGEPQRNIRKKSEKFRWSDGQGRQLSAGGILPYDEDGIWVIGEKIKDEIIYTDIGGKYQYQDGDIYKTVAREFGEELYHSSNMSREQVIEISNTSGPMYVNGHENVPVYICYIVPYNIMQSMGIVLNPVLFLKHRAEVLRGNPGVSLDKYESVVLVHIHFDSLVEMLGKEKSPISYRLRGVLKYGSLSQRLFTVPPSPARTPPPHAALGDSCSDEEEEAASQKLALLKLSEKLREQVKD